MNEQIFSFLCAYIAVTVGGFVFGFMVGTFAKKRK